MSVRDRGIKKVPRFRVRSTIALALSLVFQLEGCGHEPVAPPPNPSHKLSIVEPKPNQTGIIKIRPGKKVLCVVRLEHDGAVKSPGAAQIGLTLGETYSSQYLAEPRKVDDRTFEFEVEIEIPPSRGKYLLTASLDPLSPDQQRVTTTRDVNAE